MEEAANELINMLLEFEHGQRDEEEKAEVDSSVERNDSEGRLASFFLASGGGGGGGGGRREGDSSHPSLSKTRDAPKDASSPGTLSCLRPALAPPPPW